MTGQQRQVTVLVVLAAIWAGLIAWQVLSVEEAQRVPLVNVTGLPGGTSLTPVAGGTQPVRVNLALLKASRDERAAASQAFKNIFELDRPEQGVEEPLPPPPPLDDLDDLESFEDAPPAPPAPPAWAQLAEFRYLGYLELNNDLGTQRKVAMLARRDVLHTVQRGELIGTDVRVKLITPTTVTLTHTPSRIEQQLLLTEDGP